MEFFRTVPYAGSTENLAASASSGGGANAVVMLASAATSTAITRYLSHVSWSYSTTPSTGRLNVYSGTSSGSVIYQLDINDMGPGSLDLALGAGIGNHLTVELLQAGSSIIGRVNAYGYTA